LFIPAPATTVRQSEQFAVADGSRLNEAQLAGNPRAAF
jgi:hypothetical protein